MYAEVAMRDLLKARELGEFEAVIPELLTGYSLMDRRGQRVFHALTGESIQRSELWASYKAHVELRNLIVHRGKQVTADQAGNSISVAEAFHEYIADAWEASASRIHAGKRPGTP
ncbi:MAG TPA: hypothetical protein VFU04_00070 [Solirubrobacterales bacterium]|nr:hypothetical protein [Solirubrobacterales bacterium]